MKITLLTLILASIAFGFSLDKLKDAVDTKKASEAINKEEAKKAYAKGKNVTLEDIEKSVDTKKAKEAIDTEKLKKLF